MNRLIVILVLVAGFIGQSCKSTRDTTEKEKSNLPNRKPQELVDLVKSNDLNCDWMSIKYDVEIKTAKIDDSFKLYVRTKKDSVIWISATYYAVEVGRFLFTPDSVKYMDRKNNQYYIGDYSYVTNRFMIEADFNTLQSLILGNGTSFVSDPNQKLHSDKRESEYQLSYLTDNQLKRALKKEEAIKEVELAVSLLLNPSNFRVNQTSIVDIRDERSLIATYADEEKHCNSYHPKTITFEAISANEQATVKTSVIKISTGKSVSLSFTIPDKYEPLAP